MTSVQDDVEHRAVAATALVEGIEGRKARVYCPDWVALFRWFKPVLSTRVVESALGKIAAEVVPQMDAEAAALGRYTSAYTHALENPPSS
jgi:hypothetical protein